MLCLQEDPNYIEITRFKLEKEMKNKNIRNPEIKSK